MKSKNFRFVITEDNRIGIKFLKEPDEEIWITSTHDNIEGLTKDINALWEELKKVIEEGHKEWLKVISKKSESPDEDPSQIWKKLEKLPEKEMIKLFNSMKESLRRTVAQYVFENVNMFTGRGSVFAELYDQTTAKLENLTSDFETIE